MGAATLLGVRPARRKHQLHVHTGYSKPAGIGFIDTADKGLLRGQVEDSFLALNLNYYLDDNVFKKLALVLGA